MEKIIIGKIILFRLLCPKCGEYNLSGDNYFLCTYCKTKYDGEKIESQRIVTGVKRKNYSVTGKKYLLQKQDNKCFYCGNEFGIYYYKSGRVRTLAYHADHQIPYSYLQSNPSDNYVMACSICNLWKSNKIFEDMEECKKYLNYKWLRELSNGRIELL